LLAAPKKAYDHLYTEDYAPRAGRLPVTRPQALQLKGSLVLMVLTVFLTALAVAFYYSQLYTLNLQMDNLQNQLNSLAASTQDLDASISRYSSLDYVEQVATTKLGMVKASGEGSLTVSVAGPAENTENVSAPTPEKKVYGQRNPVLEAFNQLVSRFEQKLSRPSA